jgi:hypothetical protein
MDNEGRLEKERKGKTKGSGEGRSVFNDMRYSLFRFHSAHEMLHSTFWAWVINSLNAPAEFLSGPRRIAIRLLDRFGVSDLRVPVDVETEVKTKTQATNEQGRYDILVTDSQGTILAIENKVTAIPNKNQLDRFLKDLKERNEGKDVHLALLSTAFDVDVRHSLPDEVPYAGVEQLMEVIGPDRDSHAFVHDYVLWLEGLFEKRSTLARDSLSDDPNTYEYALKTPEGQWCLMERLTAGMKGHQYRGQNLDGTPWTEFGFVDGEGKRDALFYRIDYSKRRPYFSLRQYQKTPYPDIEAKLKRLAKLRRLWSESCIETGKVLKFIAPRNKGRKESEIAFLLLADNPPSVIVRALPNVHRAFMDKLEEAHMCKREDSERREKRGKAVLDSVSATEN